MKLSVILVLFLVSSSLGFSEAKKITPAMNNLPSADPTKATVVNISMVSYANSDPSKIENRLFILDSQAFRTIEELKNYLISMTPPSEYYFELQGIDVMPAPKISEEEVNEITTACEKAGIHFRVSPAG